MVIGILKMASNESKTEEKKEEVTEEETKKTDETVTDETVSKQIRRASIGTVIGVVFVAILCFVVLDDKYLNINISGKINIFQMSTYWHKLEFVLCYQTLGISWILFNMFYVISKRCKSEAINPMSGNEELTQMARNIMSNSLEQFIMSSFAQIISISFVEANILIKIIPLINFLFIFGRLTFFLGYPKYRTFGFLCTAIPNTLLINYNLIKFIQHLFF
jgi:hypothetical protein